MAPAQFYDCSTVQDEVVSPEPAWVQTCYTPVACPVCKDILPQHAGPVDIEVAEEPSGPLVIVAFPIRVTLYRTDLFGDLHTHMPDYYFGLVRVSGQRLSRYVSAFAGENARLPKYGSERSRYSSCPKCGRQNERMAVGKLWFKREDVGDRLVFTDTGGGSLYLAKSVLDSLAPSLKRELRPFPVDIRDPPT